MQTEIKRIQSRVLAQELTPQEIEMVAGAGCETTTSFYWDNGVRKVDGDVECKF